MVTFLDGPAKGSVLHLRRAPLLLRVVIDPEGKVDALDQLDDTPTANEAIRVCRRVGEAGMAIICSRGKGCQKAAIAEYRLYKEQPSDDVMRDTKAWRKWCEERRP